MNCLFFLLFFFLCSFKTSAQCDFSKYSAKDSAIKKYLVTIDSFSYRGSLVRDFVKQDSIKTFCSFTHDYKWHGYLGSLELSYRGFVRLKIFFWDNKFIDRLNQRTWTLANFKKCRIKYIAVQDFDD